MSVEIEQRGLAAWKALWEAVEKIRSDDVITGRDLRLMMRNAIEEADRRLQEGTRR